MRAPTAATRAPTSSRRSPTRPGAPSGCTPSRGCTGTTATRSSRRTSATARPSSAGPPASSRTSSRRSRAPSAVGDQRDLAVLVDQPLQRLVGHPHPVGVAAAPGVEDPHGAGRVVRRALEDLVDLVDRLGPPVDGDALGGGRLLLVALLVAAPLEGFLPRHVAARAQDLARRAHARALIVAGVGLGPLVGRLRPVPQPAGVVALAVEQAHHARAAEADARALAALVVEVPPALAVLQQADDVARAVELVAGLQADAVPAAHLAELLGVQPDPRATALLDRRVEVLVPVHADRDRRRRGRRRRGRERILLVVAPIGRRPA